MNGQRRTHVTIPSGLIIACLIIVFLVTAGCTDSSPHPGEGPSAQPTKISNSTVDRVEVVHFHGDQQCTSCIEVGNLAEETVKEYFPGELASGKLSFRHINYDDPVNKDIVASYGVTGSSLWITSYDETGVHRLQDMDVWYLTGDKEKYKAYLARTISESLGGNPS
jgi:thiol-disulfide isomerase/thioredoxin